jgi:hypothetical protein
MHKKDYESIAEKMRLYRSAVAKGMGDIFEHEELLADYMEQDNPRFDRERFLAACRGEDSTDSAGRKVRYAR